MAKVNPLDALVSPRPANWSSNFRVPRMPSLRESISGKNLLDGLKNHDIGMEEWRQSTEKSIDERIQQAVTQTQTSAATAATTAAAAAPSASPPPTPVPSPSSAVTSVNGKTGAVTLITDDISEGASNLFLTADRWLNLFDHYGFTRNYISSSDSVRVSVNRNWVMTGPLVVDGKLVIDGYFMAIPFP